MYLKANQMLQIGDLSSARDIAYEIKSFGTDNALNAASGLLIDMGPYYKRRIQFKMALTY